jgi:hypothetical protein
MLGVKSQNTPCTMAMKGSKTPHTMGIKTHAFHKNYIVKSQNSNTSASENTSVQPFDVIYQPSAKKTYKSNLEK